MFDKFWSWIGGQRGEYAGWTIIHRTSSEYDQHFPQYAGRIQSRLADGFPGAHVSHQHFDQHAEEPFVIPPQCATESQIAEVREQARSLYNASVTEPPNDVQTGQESNAPAPTASTTNVNDLQGTWGVIIPMFHLQISDDPPINGEWSVGDVTITFVSRNQTPRVFQNTPRPAVWERVAGDDLNLPLW